MDRGIGSVAKGGGRVRGHFQGSGLTVGVDCSGLMQGLLEEEHFGEIEMASEFILACDECVAPEGHSGSVVNNTSKKK